MKPLVLAVLVVLTACKKDRDPVVARLDGMTKAVERMPKADAPWQGAKVGDTFILGSGVRTGGDSTAKLRVGKKGKLDVAPESVVYFTRTPGRERSDLRVETGSVELEAVDESIGVGEGVLEAGGRARVEAGPDGMTIQVTVGRVVLEDNVIEEGQSVTVGVAGKAILRVDAGVEQMRPGQVAVIVRDAPARMRTSSGESELAIGNHRVDAGATLTAPAGSTLEISRDGARAVTAGPSELRIGSGTVFVEVTKGGVALHGEAAAATAKVPGGTVTANVDGAAALTVDAKETAIDGQRGQTVVNSPKGTKTLTAGQSAIMTAAGDITVAPPAPDRTVVTITAGESPVLHDPKAPVPVRVMFGDACASTGIVEVAKDRAFKKLIARSGGNTGANVLVPAGTFSYRVRCVGGKGATGTLRVDRESGRTPLPKQAARTTVEMDGREYTILYQNVLPQLTLAWRKAPPKPSYTFVIKPAKGAEKRITSPGAKLELPAGDLREGSYTTWVEAVLGARSEQSRIVIEFDNAAPSAAIDTIEVTGNAFRVKGTVIESSTVSVNSTPVALDRHQRFDTRVNAGEGEDGVGVRIAHPQAFIHYYVMRATAP